MLPIIIMSLCVEYSKGCKQILSNVLCSLSFWTKSEKPLANIVKNSQSVRDHIFTCNVLSSCFAIMKLSVFLPNMVLSVVSHGDFISVEYDLQLFYAL